MVQTDGSVSIAFPQSICRDDSMSQRANERAFAFNACGDSILDVLGWTVSPFPDGNVAPRAHFERQQKTFCVIESYSERRLIGGSSRDETRKNKGQSVGDFRITDNGPFYANACQALKVDEYDEDE
ncbi:hypothetical protein GPALN_003672 [Globodera pallida]|nr:hypothetical protein GPALN_003672 [Globodera pallida]